MPKGVAHCSHSLVGCKGILRENSALWALFARRTKNADWLETARDFRGKPPITKLAVHRREVDLSRFNSRQPVDSTVSLFVDEFKNRTNAERGATFP